MRFSPARLPTRARSLCFRPKPPKRSWTCLLYTSDAADGGVDPVIVGAHLSQPLDTAAKEEAEQLQRRRWPIIRRELLRQVVQERFGRFGRKYGERARVGNRAGENRIANCAQRERVQACLLYTSPSPRDS